jgi:hypothetical protein
MYLHGICSIHWLLHPVSLNKSQIQPCIYLHSCLWQKSTVNLDANHHGNHKICWIEVKFLQTEPNPTYRKYKESTHMPLMDNLISLTILDISPIQTLTIATEVKKILQLCTVSREWESFYFLCRYHTENLPSGDNVISEDVGKVQSLKRCALNKRQESVIKKDIS